MNNKPTILTKAIINNATQAVDSYVSTANSLKGDLDSIISTLIASDFNGDASTGYKVFYDSRVVPAITQNLTDKGSIMDSIKNMLDSIQTQLLDTVDPQLGNNNQNPGSAG